MGASIHHHETAALCPLKESPLLFEYEGLRQHWRRNRLLGCPALCLVTVPTELHDVWVYYNSHIVMDNFI